jgi:hypothetical protein
MFLKFIFSMELFQTTPSAYHHRLIFELNQQKLPFYYLF